MADHKDPKPAQVDPMLRIAIALEAIAMRHGEVSACEKAWGPLPGSRPANASPAQLTADELAKLRAVLNG